MKRDLDKKLYNDYLNGEKQSFEYLYSKYKSKVEYFIYNIVRDYQKAEDLTQETFIYVMQNKMQDNISFKCFVYLVARSKAYNYINVEKRRNEINQQYFANESEKVDKDVLEIITKEESKKELLNAIEELDVKYKNAVYLVNIEGLSYIETSEILGESLQNTKNLIHRGKKQLRNILLKKGFDEMNKVVKVCIVILGIIISLTGITYAGVKIYNEFIKKQDEINSRGLFDLGDGITTYEIDLMANDMIWNGKSRLYHKILTNIEDYEKYKLRLSDLPDKSEINFEENFVVIIANENIREMHEKDMTIYNVTADETTTHIIMKQKENPNYNDENNIWYAIVDRTLLRDNADVTIEYRKINVNGVTDINNLSDDYGIDEAIDEGCIVLENNKVKSDNLELLDKFIEDTENKKNSSLRIYTTYNGKMIEETYIKDIEYYNGIYYIYSHNLKDVDESYFRSCTKLKKINSALGLEYLGVTGNSTGGVPLIIVQ